MEMNAETQTAGKQRYRWPWFVLAALILAVILTVIWMSFEVSRVKRIRDLNQTEQKG